jgi:peptide chain release factor 1
MLEQLDLLEKQFDDLNEKLSDPQVLSDRAQLQRVGRERARLEPMVRKFREYKEVRAHLDDARASLSDADLRELAEEEIAALQPRLATLEEELRLALLPRDPQADNNCIMEIRAGTGGEEAALFAGDLYRMYTRFAQDKGWKVEPLNVNVADMGGIKEAVFAIEGAGAFGALKYESGVHRVQRVPATEASGRIHTSAATVAVLPEAEEVDIQIDPNDLKIDTYRAGSAGGQNVQKNETAIRITHLPSGLVVTCQDERSQLQNREKAMRVLRSRLLDMERQKREAEQRQMRQAQVKSGDRSDKIRTYNFPQNRVTDHRINLSLHALEKILDGEVSPLIQALQEHEQQELLKSGFTGS